MRIIIVTQNEPIYLAENLHYLFKSLPETISIVGVCLTSPSPFGKKESFLKKTLKIIKIFGLEFSLFYSFQYLFKFFNKSNNLDFILKKFKINKIELNESINSKQSIAKFSVLKPDLIISILGNEIFKKEILAIPKMGIINLHSSLLPKYRGLMPTFWVLKNKERNTGVSVFFVDEGIDSGPILMQREIPIKCYNSHKDLIYITKKAGMELIILVLKKLIANEKINLIKNSEEEMSYYSFPTRRDVKDFLNEGNRFF